MPKSDPARNGRSEERQVAKMVCTRHSDEDVDLERGQKMSIRMHHKLGAFQFAVSLSPPFGYINCTTWPKLTMYPINRFRTRHKAPISVCYFQFYIVLHTDSLLSSPSSAYKTPSPLFSFLSPEFTHS